MNKHSRRFEALLKAFPFPSARSGREFFKISVTSDSPYPLHANRAKHRMRPRGVAREEKPADENALIRADESRLRCRSGAANFLGFSAWTMMFSVFSARRRGKGKIMAASPRVAPLFRTSTLRHGYWSLGQMRLFALSRVAMAHTPSRMLE